jgi:nitrile hydratase
MNGVHDMGGMHGFGAIPDDAAAFHADWERTAYAMNKLVRLQGLYNIHEYRHSVERMDPAAYLGATYFERWFTAVEQLLLENDVLEAAEIERRLAAVQAGDLDLSNLPEPSDSTADLRQRVQTAFRTSAGDVSEATDPAYEAGDRVEVRNEHPEGHTRSPRYARGAVGTVAAVLGAFELPDAAAHGGERSEPVYTVEFDAHELWGDDTDADVVALDMWESYLTDA